MIHKINAPNPKLTLVAGLLVSLLGCASNPAPQETDYQVEVKPSYLATNEGDKPAEQSNSDVEREDALEGGLTRLNRLDSTTQGVTLEVDLSKRFGNEARFQVSVNALPFNDFIHYALGELLQISYLVEPSVKNINTPVTLSLQDKVSAQRLFQLVQEVLAQSNVKITQSDDIFYIVPSGKDSKSDNAFGFGRSISSVPNVAGEIVQLVPAKYGVSTSLRNTVGGLVDASVGIDPAQNLITIKGRREQIIRALGLIDIIDSPKLNNKASAILSFRYIDSQTFIGKASELLELEGISTAAGRTTSTSLYFIPLEHLGKVVVFATADEIIDRVDYWRKELDKPATGAEQSFYIYHPQFARAADMGASLAPLLGDKSGVGSANRRNRSTSNNQASQETATPARQNSEQTQVQTIENDEIRVVVDERANALIFYSTGQYYQELQPILRQLDIMPKQVMMELVIAEVKLTGSFAKGVQFAIENGSLGGNTDTFSFNSKDGFKYSIVGLDGNVTVNLSERDGLVNVLSRPTLLVRDGVAANFSVGDDIPTVGSTTSDPINGERETTTVQYRKTGVDLTVTPTINAQGTVIMTIDQKISTANPDSEGAGGNPSIFERTLSTEVVAGDGQTVMLGGLISENRSTDASQVPLLGELPLLGHLFRGDSGNHDKTELVVLVTPKIINGAQDWQRVEQSFKQGLENLRF